MIFPSALFLYETNFLIFNIPRETVRRLRYAGYGQHPSIKKGRDAKRQEGAISRGDQYDNSNIYSKFTYLYLMCINNRKWSNSE